MIRHAAVIGLAWCAFAAGTGHAVDAILVSDTYDSYAAASAVGASASGSAFTHGVGWQQPDGWFLMGNVGDPSRPAGGTVATPGITIGGVSTPNRLETVNAGFVGRVFSSIAPTTGNPVYIRFGLKGTSLQGIASASATNDNVIAFSQTTWVNQKFTMNTQGTRTGAGAATPNQIRWRLNSQNVATTANSAADADDLAHEIVLKVEHVMIGPGSFIDTVTLYLDPPGSIEPATTLFPTFSISDATFDRISFTAAGTGLFAKIAIDQFRIGTSWSAVTGTAVPIVQTLSPTVGPTVTKTTVAFTGENFSGAPTVTFGAGTPDDAVVMSTTSMTAVAKAYPTAGPVDVTVLSAGGTTTVTNAFTYQIPTAANPVPLTPPSLSGSAAPGGTLTVHPGTWSPTVTAFDYEWQRADDLAGTNLVAVGTQMTYGVTQTDFGSYLRVRVRPTGTPSTAFTPYVQSRIAKASSASLRSTVGPSGSTCGLGAASALILGFVLFIRARRSA